MDFKEQILWVRYHTDSGKIYLITSDKYRDMYYLWKDVKGKPAPTKYRAEDPTELYKYCKE